MASSKEDDVPLEGVVSDRSESWDDSDSESSSSSQSAPSDSRSRREALKSLLKDESAAGANKESSRGQAEVSSSSRKYSERSASRLSAASASTGNDLSPPEAPPLLRGRSGIYSAAEMRAKRTKKQESGLLPIDEREDPHNLVSDAAMDALIAEAEVADDPGFAPQHALPKKLRKLLADESEELDVTFVVDGSSRYISHDDRLASSQKGRFGFGKKRKCCKCTRKEVWTFEIPYIPIKILPVGLVDIILIVLFLLFYYIWVDYFLDEVRIFRYLVFLLVWFNVYFAAVVLFHWINLLLTAIIDSPKFHFYLDDLEGSIAFVGWAIVLAIVWPYLLFPSYGATTGEVFRVLTLVFVVISIIYFFKVLIMKLLLGYRQRAGFHQRIEESLYKERVLVKLLRDPMPDWEERHKATEYMILHPFGRSVADPTTFDHLVRQIFRYERMSITARSKTPNSERNKSRWQSKYFDPNYGKGDNARDEAATALAKTARCPMRKAFIPIFQKLCRRKRAPWVLEAKDFQPYFTSELKAKHAYLLFNRSSETKGFISMQEMIEAVKQIYTDRANLAKSLRNHYKIIRILSGILNMIGFLIFLVAFLVIIGVDVFELVVPYTAFVLGFSFIFGDSLKNAFHSFIFIFFVNAYDVGDLVDINGSYVEIEDMTLLTTSAFVTDGRKILVSNASMLSRDIVNYTRSRNFAFGIDIWIKVDTPVEKIQTLRQRLLDYPKLLPQLWNGVSVNLRELDRSDSMNLFVWAEMKNITWAIWAQNAPRTQLYFYIQQQINDLGIVGYLPPRQLVLDPRSAPLELKPHKKMRRLFAGGNSSRRVKERTE